MIDSHCHLDFLQFDEDRAEVIQSSLSLGIRTILLPGTHAAGWSKQITLCTQFPQLRYALGLHPYFLSQYRQEHLTELKKLINDLRQQVLAVGEIGLDFAIAAQNTEQGKLQIEVFEEQLTLAQENQLPVIVHHRQSHNEIIRILKSAGLTQGGVIHAFSGSYQQARQYVDMGFKLGVGGTITYPRAAKTRLTIGKMPLDALLLETDAPDMPVSGKQGKRNSPENLPEILNALAEIRSESREQIELATDLNFAALFVPDDLPDVVAGSLSQ